MVPKKYPLVLFSFIAFNVQLLSVAPIVQNECISYEAVDRSGLLNDETAKPEFTTCTLSSAYRFCVSVDCAEGIATIDTIYGTTTVQDQLICELLTSAAMERLKYVRQYGTFTYGIPGAQDFSRFEHSVGVFQLLRMFDAPYVQQVAGLLHDASHGIFSHAIDYMHRAASSGKAYQDEIHEWYLQASGLESILRRYGLSVHDVLMSNCPMLDSELPELCADRLEYNLMGAVLEGFLTPEQVKILLNDLHYDAGSWYFSSGVPLVKQLALSSAYHSEHIWGGIVSGMLNRWTADLLEYAIDVGIIRASDINFGIDHEVWMRLCACNDAVVAQYIARIKNPGDYYTVSASESWSHRIRSKFRGIDPLVKNSEGILVRFSVVDQEFHDEYMRVRELVSNGWYLTLR